MVEIKTWLNQFLQLLEENFSGRVWFVGLQGSYGRGEATENSDIDVVVILDELSVLDIQAYHDMLEKLPDRDLICGFLSGKNDLLNWETSDLFQFCYDTKPIRGSLDEVTALIDKAAVKRAIKTGVCSIFHGCVHNMLHTKSEEILKGLYKSASFVVQAICFMQTGSYASRLKDVMKGVSAEEQAILQTFSKLKHGEPIAFDEMSQNLFVWAQKWIAKTE